MDSVTGSAKAARAVLKAGQELLGKDNEMLRSVLSDLDEFEAAVSCGELLSSLRIEHLGHGSELRQNILWELLHL